MTEQFDAMLAEMRGHRHQDSAFPELRLWADRLAAAHEREVGEYERVLRSLETRIGIATDLLNGVLADTALSGGVTPRRAERIAAHLSGAGTAGEGG